MRVGTVGAADTGDSPLVHTADRHTVLVWCWSGRGMISPDRTTLNRHYQRSQQDQRSGDTRQQSLGAELSEVDLPKGQNLRESPEYEL